MTTVQMHFPVATNADAFGVVNTLEVALHIAGNFHGIAARADQAALHTEGQRITLDPHFWMVPTIVDC